MTDTEDEITLSLIRRMDAAYGACQRTGNPVLCRWYDELKARVDKRLGMDGPKVVPFRRREERSA